MNQACRTLYCRQPNDPYLTGFRDGARQRNGYLYIYKAIFRVSPMPKYSERAVFIFAMLANMLFDFYLAASTGWTSESGRARMRPKRTVHCES